MTDPMVLFPRDEDGRLRGGFFKAFPHHLIEKAQAHGWVRLVPNVPHPLEDYGDWLIWRGKGKPWLP